MIELIEKLIYESYHKTLNSCLIAELENNVAVTKRRLSRNFNKRQKKLLLRIEDAKNLKAERCSYESFIAGFKLGLKLGYETNQD